MGMAAKLKQYLQDEGLRYDLIAHPRTETSRETAAAAHIPDDHIAKGVVLKDDTGFVLLVTAANRWAKVHAVQEALHRPLELADETSLATIFDDCALGSVPAAGQAYGLETLLDEELTALADVYFEAGDHERLVRLSGDQFMQMMRGARRGHFTHES